MKIRGKKEFFSFSFPKGRFITVVLPLADMELLRFFYKTARQTIMTKAIITWIFAILIVG